MSGAANSAVRVGVIGAGLMGREVASAFGRWFALLDCPVRPELVAVCDVNAAALDWFRQVPGVKHFDTDHRALLARPEVDVVYVALPHHLHEAIYLDVLRAGLRSWNSEFIRQEFKFTPIGRLFKCFLIHAPRAVCSFPPGSHCLRWPPLTDPFSRIIF